MNGKLIGNLDFSKVVFDFRSDSENEVLEITTISTNKHRTDQTYIAGTEPALTRSYSS